MNKEQLRAELEQLHAELQQTKTLDPQQREKLQTLANDIHEVLSRDEGEAQHDTGLGERLNDAVAQLEASHPRITLLLRQTIDSLAYLGI